MVYGRYRNRPIVKSDKHEVTWSNLASDASSTTSINLATAVPVGDKNTSTECAVGSHVTSIYFEFNVAAQVTTNPKVVHWVVETTPTGVTAVPQAPSAYYDAQRSLIIKRGMEMLPSDQATVFKRIFVVRIPKARQRMAEGSQFNFRYICTSAETINFCGFAIYKEKY